MDVTHRTLAAFSLSVAIGLATGGGSTALAGPLKPEEKHETGARSVAATPTAVKPSPTGELRATPTPTKTVEKRPSPTPTVAARQSATPTPVGEATPMAVTTRAAEPTPKRTPESSSGTVVPEPTSTPTVRAAGPTSTGASAKLAVSAIEPAAISNDEPVRLTITGTGFADGQQVAIDGQRLREVRIESPTRLSATLPDGVCPGTYRATVSDGRGEQVSGGQLAVRGVRNATLGDWSPAPPIKLTGKPRTITVPLPLVEVIDTTCSAGDWRIELSLGPFSPDSDGRSALSLRSMRLTNTDFSRMAPTPSLLLRDGAKAASAGRTSGGQPATGGSPRRSDFPLQAQGGRTTAVLTVSRGAHVRGATLRPEVEVEVPSHPDAGQYTMTVTVSLAEAP